MDVVADGSVRWLSYAELAEALANRESARQLTLRKCWGRHKGNDERARVSVPVSALPDPSAGTSARTSSRTDGRRSVGADGEASALQVKLGELEAALRVKLAELEAASGSTLRRTAAPLRRTAATLRRTARRARGPASASAGADAAKLVEVEVAASALTQHVGPPKKPQSTGDVWSQLRGGRTLGSDRGSVHSLARRWRRPVSAASMRSASSATPSLASKAPTTGTLTMT